MYDHKWKRKRIENNNETIIKSGITHICLVERYFLSVEHMLSGICWKQQVT